MSEDPPTEKFGRNPEFKFSRAKIRDKYPDAAIDKRSTGFYFLQ
jgi:hypothetical protein